jgi:succinoglycan biosynthesis protein ExoV
MKLYYRHVPRGNFGDDLNPWIWPRLLPGVLDENDSILFIGIGSILNEQIPFRPFKVVFGSGVGYGKAVSLNHGRWEFYCVRGPLTAQALNLPTKLGITDAGILVRNLQLPKLDKIHGVSFMPHQTSAALGDWEEICDAVGINFIHPSGGVETVLSGICSSKLLITEAMHGAIVADALRVPWVPVRGYFGIPKLKWWDWCLSIGLEYRPINIPCIWRKENIVRLLRRRLLRRYNPLYSIREFLSSGLIRGGSEIMSLGEKRRKDRAMEALKGITKSEPSLSKDDTIASLTEQMEERLEIFKRNLSSGYFD